MVVTVNFTIFKLLFTIFSLLTIFYYIGKYSSKVASTVNPIRYFLGTILLVMLFFALYNYVGYRTGLYKPITLDNILNPVFDKIKTAFDGFFRFIFSLFNAEQVYEQIKTQFERLSNLF